MNRRLLDDCFLHDRERLRHADALAILRERVNRVVESETVPLAQASGRILAERIDSPSAVPAFDNAAVDGYAFRAADYEATGGWFPVAFRIAAGDRSPARLPAASAARIFTGAPMPQGADTVAMQEDCEPHVQDEFAFVAIPPGLKPGANRRSAGEDLQVGDMVAAPARLLRPQDLAAIASTGRDKVDVYRCLRVALLSTGSEIVRPGVPLSSGQVFDANHYLLRALLAPLNVSVTDLGVLPDDAQTIEAALAEAAETHDAIISTGGASRGEEDHIVTAMDRIGRRHLWQLAVKPGRPMSFGQIGDTVFIGLPGNPVAAFVCFLLYVRPTLRQLAGAEWEEPQRYTLPAAFALKQKKTDRREFLRGILESDDGTLSVGKFARDGSGLISGLRAADGLIEIGEDVDRVAEGDPVTFIPFSQFGF